MKMNDDSNADCISSKPGLTRRGLASCRKLLAQIKKTRDAISREFRRAFQTDARLLGLALNEAEALAWQTDYPHLLFPVLAQEKVQLAARWEIKQQSLRTMASPDSLPQKNWWATTATLPFTHAVN
jgi:hypothetical protein